MMGLKAGEIVLILAVLLLLFGATRLPQLGSSVGAAIRNFKKGFSGTDDAEEDTKQAPSSSSSDAKSTTRLDEGVSSKTPSKEL